MTPYAQAWEAYHSHGRPTWAFHEVVAEHFRCGVVISKADCFVLARRVDAADGDGFHLSPLDFRPGGDCWMIWLAAGKLGALLALLEDHRTEWVSYTRGASNRVRRVRTEQFLRHESESPEATAARSASRIIHGAGTSGGGS